MRRSTITFVLLAILTVLGLFNCQMPQTPATGSVVLNITFPDDSMSTPGSSKIAVRITDAEFNRVNCTIFLNGFTEWESDLNRVGNYYTADIELTVSSGYTAQISGYMDWLLCYTGTSDPFTVEGGKTVDVTIPLIKQLPSYPSGLDATVNSTSSITLQWNDNSYNEKGFRIDRKTGSTAWVQIAEVGQDVEAYLNTGLTAGTEYFYHVRSYNGAGNSGYSNMDSSTTEAIPTIPAYPTGLDAITLSSSSIKLAWNDNSTNELGFKIDRKTSSSNWAQIDMVGQNIKTYQDNGLTANTEYFYHVRSYNGAGNSGYSNMDSATTQATQTIPAYPTGLDAITLSSSSIKLAWNDNSTNELGFKIDRKTSSSNWAQIDMVGQNIKTYQDNGLTANTEYFYHVRSYNGAGNSGYSNMDSATTYTTGNNSFIIYRDGGFTEAGFTVMNGIDGGYVIAYSDGNDAYLWKLNSSGGTIWIRNYGFGSTEDVRGLCAMGSIGYLLTGWSGTPNTQALFFRTDIAGNYIPPEQYAGGTGNEVMFDCIASSDGKYALAGITNSYGGYGDVFFLKLNADLSTITTRHFGGSNHQEARGIVQSSDGGFVLAGSTAAGSYYYEAMLLKLNNSGDSLWTRTYGGPGTQADGFYGLANCSDGGFIATGYYGTSPYLNIYLVRTNSSGDQVWEKNYGGSGNDMGNSVIQAMDGNFIVTGSRVYTDSRGQNLWLAKVNFSTGDIIWERDYGGTGIEEGYSVKQTPDGGYIVSGHTTSYGGDYDVYVVKTDANGNVQ